MIGKDILYLLIFPGFLFTAVAGSFVAVLDRKVSARFQYRVGPPWRQGLFDIFKLFGKETVLAKNTLTPVFIAAPLVALSAISLAAALVGTAAFLGLDMVGDVIFLIYLLLMLAVSLVLGGFASGNVLSAQGASREINLTIAYELPFFMSMLIPIIKSGYAVRFSEILARQAAGGAIIASVSGAVGFVVAVLCIQAKMGLPPFDMSEAETELAGGLLMEYNGPLLAIWRLVHYMQYIVLPLMLTVLFLGGIPTTTVVSFLLGLLKYAGVVVLLIIIRNTNPRIKIDGALRFFWRPLALVAAVGVCLALIGV